MLILGGAPLETSIPEAGQLLPAVASHYTDFHSFTYFDVL